MRLLTDGNRAALPRHRTLRAMLEWSHDLLDAPERALLRRLAVFAGGWTIEACESVAAGQPIDASAVLPLLTKLVEKSLVAYESREEERRYRLLETVRQFAREQLTDVGEIEATRRQHAHTFLQLAETLEPSLDGPNPRPALDLLEQEVDNLRAVLAWSIERSGTALDTEAAEIGLRLAASVRRFWQGRGYATEGRSWLMRLLRLAERSAACLSPPSALLGARASHAAGRLALWQGDGEATRAFLQKSLALAERAGDRTEVARALQALGAVANYCGEFEAAKQHLTQSLAIYREIADRRMIAILCNSLAMTTREQGEYERSRSLFEESLRFYREIGDRAFARHPLANLGMLETLLGDYASARVYLAESVRSAREVGDPGCAALFLDMQGSLARHEGDLEAACARHTEALRLHHAEGSRGEIARCLAALGCATFMTGERAAGSGAATEAERKFVRGARLLGAAEALREATGWVIWSYDRPEYERCRAAVRAPRNEAAFAAAWAEGRALSLDEACALALADVG